MQCANICVQQTQKAGTQIYSHSTQQILVGTLFACDHLVDVDTADKKNLRKFKVYSSEVFLRHLSVKCVPFRFISAASITHLCSSTISLLSESSSLMAEKSAARLAALFWRGRKAAQSEPRVKCQRDGSTSLSSSLKEVTNLRQIHLVSVSKKQTTLNVTRHETIERNKQQHKRNQKVIKSICLY